MRIELIQKSLLMVVTLYSTIVEAAIALYQNHSVANITRSDAGAINLTKTTSVISDIIERPNRNTQKSFVLLQAFLVQEKH